MAIPQEWRWEWRTTDGTTCELEIIFIALDHPDDVRKIRGANLTWVFANEIRELAQENVMMLAGRTGRYPPEGLHPDCWFGLWGDCQPADMDHWLADLLFNVKPEGWLFLEQPPAVIEREGRFVVNPLAENLAVLGPNYYRDAMSGAKRTWILQNLAMQWIIHTDGRAVHPTFSQDLHVAGYELEPTPGIELHVGIDFGRTPAATIGQRQLDGQWLILDELRTENTSVLEFGRLLSEVLNSKYSGYRYVATGDPAGVAQAEAVDLTNFDALRHNGIEAEPALTNDPETRIAAGSIRCCRYSSLEASQDS